MFISNLNLVYGQSDFMIHKVSGTQIVIMAIDQKLPIVCII